MTYFQDFLERRVGDKTAQVFNDEQVVAFDCAERLAGYQFVGLLDHDEFIIPSQPSVKTLKHLLVRNSSQIFCLDMLQPAYLKL